MKIETLPEDSIVQRVFHEAQRLRAQHRVIRYAELTEAEYLAYRKELDIPESAPPLAALPIGQVYFKVRYPDGSLENPAEREANRLVKPLNPGGIIH